MNDHQPYPAILPSRRPVPTMPWAGADGEWERPMQFWSNLTSSEVQWVISTGYRRGYRYKVMNYVTGQGYWLLMEEN